MNLTNIKTKLNQPIDIAGLVYIRIAFGLILLIEVIRYFNHNWIERYFIEPKMYFPYEGFYWLHLGVAMACTIILLHWVF